MAAEPLFALAPRHGAYASVAAVLGALVALAAYEQGWRALAVSWASAALVAGAMIGLMLNAPEEKRPPGWMSTTIAFGCAAYASPALERRLRALLGYTALTAGGNQLQRFEAPAQATPAKEKARPPPVVVARPHVHRLVVAKDSPKSPQGHSPQAPTSPRPVRVFQGAAPAARAAVGHEQHRPRTPGLPYTPPDDRLRVATERAANTDNMWGSMIIKPRSPTAPMTPGKRRPLPPLPPLPHTELKTPQPPPRRRVLAAAAADQRGTDDGDSSPSSGERSLTEEGSLESVSEDFEWDFDESEPPPQATRGERALLLLRWCALTAALVLVGGAVSLLDEAALAQWAAETPATGLAVAAAFKLLAMRRRRSGERKAAAFQKRMGWAPDGSHALGGGSPTKAAAAWRE